MLTARPVPDQRLWGCAPSCARPPAAVRRVDKAKAIDAIKERRAKKEAAGAGSGAGAGAGGSEAGVAKPTAEAGAAAPAEGAAAGGSARAGGPRFERHFGQRRVKADPVNDERAPVLASDVLTLFGKKR